MAGVAGVLGVAGEWEAGFTGPEMSPESGGGYFGSFAGSKKDKQKNWWFGVDKCRSSILS